MISPPIKDLIEQKLGKPVCSPIDCEHLSSKIKEETGSILSISTVKRLFGFTMVRYEPRRYTLVTIAQYVGFKDWEELIRHINETSSSEFTNLKEINVDTLKKGAKIKFTYSPSREVTIKFIDGKRFKVLESTNSKLLKDDIIEVNYFVMDFPLIVEKLWRNERNMGQFVAGKVSGITSLRVM